MIIQKGTLNGVPFRFGAHNDWRPPVRSVSPEDRTAFRRAPPTSRSLLGGAPGYYRSAPANEASPEQRVSMHRRPMMKAFFAGVPDRNKISHPNQLLQYCATSNKIVKVRLS